MSKLLIHIGYAKAGSSTLQDWFRRHPQLRYAPGGLGGFKSVYEICRQASQPGESSPTYYVTSFEDLSGPWGSSSGVVPIDFGRRNADLNWPMHCRQAHVCSTLDNLFPGAHILIVTRGLQGLIQSAYSQYVKTGGITHPCAFWAQLSRGLAQWTDFDHLIRLYRDAFGADQVLVLPYELLRDDPPAFIATLEERLGLCHYDIEIVRLNPSLSPEELYWYPVVSNLVSALAWRLGEARFVRIYRWYVRKTLVNRWWWLVKVLNRFRPGTITSADFPWDEILPRLKGKAESLRGDPLYAPYAREYLWDA